MNSNTTNKPKTTKNEISLSFTITVLLNNKKSVMKMIMPKAISAY